MTDQSLAKATLVAKDLNDQVECRFNPREYVVAKSATWTRTPARGAASAPTPEFVGTNPRTLQMELFFDDWNSGSSDVSQNVEKLLAWTNPTSDSINSNKCWLQPASVQRNVAPKEVENDSPSRNLCRVVGRLLRAF